MVRHIHRIPAWQRRALYGTGVTLAVTGSMWLALHYSVGGGAAELPHPLEAWLMRLHGLAGFAGLFMLGAVTAAHLPQGWRMTARHRWVHQRNSGIALCALGALLALSAYLLNYFAPVPIRPALGWAHAVTGLSMGALVTRHRRRASLIQSRIA